MYEKPVAIIDVGSNSVRLVVYAGSPRVPFILFNEKVLAGLGEGLALSGELSVTSQDRALAALRRFHILTRQMDVGQVRVVATAAVRDAFNGAAFLGRIRDIGFEPEVLSGEQEARMAGQGVLSAIPEADGIVGDLGGGSLELVDRGGRDPPRRFASAGRPRNKRPGKARRRCEEGRRASRSGFRGPEKKPSTCRGSGARWRGWTCS
jgi:exopolyphosphatase/guanosine-5'-triphosphate,3'-diphosphate pyrophosphatase